MPPTLLAAKLKAIAMSRLPLVIVTVLALALAACGVRGSLQPPPGAPPPQNDPYHLDPLI